MERVDEEDDVNDVSLFLIFASSFIVIVGGGGGEAKSRERWRWRTVFEIIEREFFLCVEEWWWCDFERSLAEERFAREGFCPAGEEGNIFLPRVYKLQPTAGAAVESFF